MKKKPECCLHCPWHDLIEKVEKNVDLTRDEITAVLSCADIPNDDERASRLWCGLPAITRGGLSPNETTRKNHMSGIPGGNGSGLRGLPTFRRRGGGRSGSL